MKFISENEIAFCRAVLSEPTLTVEELMERYIASKDDVVSRALDWKRSSQQSQNWRKYREHYKRGMKRYQRLRNLSPLLGRAKSWIEKLKEGKLRKMESFDALADISSIRAILCEEGSRWDLEENFVETFMFLRCVFENLAVLEKQVLSIEASLAPEIVEAVEIILDFMSLTEESCNEQSNS